MDARSKQSLRRPLVWVALVVAAAGAVAGTVLAVAALTDFGKFGSPPQPSHGPLIGVVTDSSPPSGLLPTLDPAARQRECDKAFAALPNDLDPAIRRLKAEQLSEICATPTGPTIPAAPATP